MATTVDLCAVHGAANGSTNAPDKEVMCDLRCSAMLEIHVGCHGTGALVRQAKDVASTAYIIGG